MYRKKDRERFVMFLKLDYVLPEICFLCINNLKFQRKIKLKVHLGKVNTVYIKKKVPFPEYMKQF